MNRSCNRENPHILIVMIAEKQIMKGGGDGKGREIMGPQKPAREMSGTAPKSNLLPHHSFFFLSLSIPLFYSCVALLSLSLQFSLHEGVHFMHLPISLRKLFLAFGYPLSCFLVSFQNFLSFIFDTHLCLWALKSCGEKDGRSLKIWISVSWVSGSWRKNLTFSDHANKLTIFVFLLLLLRGGWG